MYKRQVWFKISANKEQIMEGVSISAGYFENVG